MITLGKKELSVRLNVSTAWIDKAVRQGIFPKPFYISPQKPQWDEKDINDWLQAKKDGGNHGTASVSATEDVGVA